MVTRPRFVVMSVESRAPYVAYLRRHVPDLEEFCDAGLLGAFRTWLWIMEAIDATGAVVLEDDVLLTRGFADKAAAVVAQHPNDLVQFFSMRKDDRTKGSRWDRKFAMNQCVWFPPGMPSRFIAYEAEHDFMHSDKTWGAYDTMMNAALRSWRMPYWLHVPSLVDHLQLRSVIDPRRSTKRQSLTFTDPELSGFPLQEVPRGHLA